jgi:hypothetical protein
MLIKKTRKLGATVAVNVKKSLLREDFIERA